MKLTFEDWFPDIDDHSPDAVTRSIIYNMLVKSRDSYGYTLGLGKNANFVDAYDGNLASIIYHLNRIYGYSIGVCWWSPKVFTFSLGLDTFLNKKKIECKWNDMGLYKAKNFAEMCENHEIMIAIGNYQDIRDSKKSSKSFLFVLELDV